MELTIPTWIIITGSMGIGCLLGWAILTVSFMFLIKQYLPNLTKEQERISEPIIELENTSSEVQRKYKRALADAEKNKKQQ